MHTSLFLVSLFLYILVDAQSYVLEDDYAAATFFDMFDFFTAADPTNGYVSYVDQGTAQNQGLINTNNGTIYMGVDHTNVATGSGRASVRIESKKSYNHGLIILDLAHMPGGICGTWPAFWMLGPNWPNSGEIDIIEGVNSAVTNQMTLHTNAGCSITNSATPFLGTLVTPNCDVNAPGQAANAGCSISSSNSQTFGAGFNAVGGGLFATEWTSEAISIYFFPRTAIPADITNGNPDPSGWGEPQAVFSGACDIDTHVVDQKLVFDTTFCGDWAGNVWSSDAGLCRVWLVTAGIHQHNLAHSLLLANNRPLVDHNIEHDTHVQYNLPYLHDPHYIYDYCVKHLFRDAPDHHRLHNAIPFLDDSLIYNLRLQHISHPCFG